MIRHRLTQFQSKHISHFFFKDAFIFKTICQIKQDFCCFRHQGLKCLLDRPNSSPASSDPYNVEERDPLKSNAINSSLWELQTLQNHVLPGVATAAKFIDNHLPTVERDLGELLDKTSNDIFDKEISKITKNIVLNFEKRNGLSIGKGERVMQYWNVYN